MPLLKSGLSANLEKALKKAFNSFLSICLDAG
jgi:hypothetical protein